MGAKRRNSVAKKQRPNKFMKTNVRLFKLSDVIFMLQSPEERDMEVLMLRAGPNGFEMKLRMGVGFAGMPIAKLWSSDWISVADSLGMDKAELVKNPDGNLYVLLYDKEMYNGYDKT